MSTVGVKTKVWSALQDTLLITSEVGVIAIFMVVLSGQVPVMYGLLSNPTAGTVIDSTAGGALTVPDLVWDEIVPPLLPVATIVYEPGGISIVGVIEYKLFTHVVLGVDSFVGVISILTVIPVIHVPVIIGLGLSPVVGKLRVRSPDMVPVCEPALALIDG